MTLIPTLSIQYHSAYMMYDLRISHPWPCVYSVRSCAQNENNTCRTHNIVLIPIFQDPVLFSISCIYYIQCVSLHRTLWRLEATHQARLCIAESSLKVEKICNILLSFDMYRIIIDITFNLLPDLW